TFFKKQGTDTKPAVPASRKRAREEPAEPVQDELDRVLDEEANEETKPQTTTHQTGTTILAFVCWLLPKLEALILFC
ncbi:uncharacterized protein ACA1_171700, partial [Acanthamoeba castellanii str. Neff]